VKLQAVIAVLAVCVLAGFGQPARGQTPPPDLVPDDVMSGVAFVPPLDWLRVPLTLGFQSVRVVGVWAAPPKPGALPQTINLVFERFAGTLDEYMASNLRAVRANPAFTLQSEPSGVTQCGSTPAYRLYATLRTGDRTLRQEQVFILGAAGVYLATYTYGEQAQPLPVAEKALASLCPHGGIPT
jgi:hypothetical protein